MNIDDLRHRLREGKPALGAWIGIPHPIAAEAVVSLGFHWMAVDMEHGGASVDQAMAGFLAAKCHGCVPLARLPSADPYLARRLLDGGAQGLIVPVVESVEEWSAFAIHCLYPPAGRRGVGLSRCNSWGDSFKPYLEDFRPLLVPQIETRKGVAASDALAARDEVDALFLGPYDLSADLGTPGDFTAPAVVTALDRVRAACESAGKPCGIHQVAPDAGELAARVAEGFRFIAYSTDVIALRTALAGVKNLL